MKNICFFNHWHNGDVFAGKGYIQEVARNYPDINIAYAHINHPKIVADVGEHLHCDDLPDGMVDQGRFADSEDEVFVNTWIGCYGWDVMPRGEDHANWPSLHRMFNMIYSQINAVTGSNLVLSPNPLDYLPTTDWSQFDIANADKFASEHKNIVLVCNGLVRSTQSNIGLMQEVINQLATKHADFTFVCTAKFETTLDNVHFTDDIFNLDNDINEIAYLSTKARVIVGKNSGPYMFAHVKENIMDSTKSFVSLSHRPSDCYPFGVVGLECQYFHCSTDDEAPVTSAIDHAINTLGNKGLGRVEILG